MSEATACGQPVAKTLPPSCRSVPQLRGQERSKGCQQRIRVSSTWTTTLAAPWHVSLDASSPSSSASQSLMLIDEDHDGGDGGVEVPAPGEVLCDLGDGLVQGAQQFRAARGEYALMSWDMVKPPIDLHVCAYLVARR